MSEHAGRPAGRSPGGRGPGRRASRPAPAQAGRAPLRPADHRARSSTATRWWSRSWPSSPRSCVGGLLIAFTDPVVLHAWSTFFSAPGRRDQRGLGRGRRRLLAHVRGLDLQPARPVSGRVPRRLGRRGLLPAVARPASDATPLILAGLSVALAFRAGLFNIGAAGQFIGGAIWPPGSASGSACRPSSTSSSACSARFVGGAVIGWLVGVLKARTGAHEVIVTIMLNYVMYNLLSYPAGTRPCSAARADQPDQPGHRDNAHLPHCRRPAAAGQRGLPARAGLPRPACGGC